MTCNTTQHNTHAACKFVTTLANSTINTDTNTSNTLIWQTETGYQEKQDEHEDARLWNHTQFAAHCLWNDLFNDLRIFAPPSIPQTVQVAQGANTPLRTESVNG